MEIRKATRETIQLVEEISGLPVQITEDPKIQTLASVRMARKRGLPQHIIVYKPEFGEPPDYQICFQCGYIIRLFENPPDNRFDMKETQTGREEVEKLIMKPGGLKDKFRLRKSQISEMKKQFLSGLLIHLRSVPIGLRISEWLSSTHPELEDLKKRHVEKEININKQSLSGEIRLLTPPKIYDASQSISAAYAIYWAEKYNKPEWVNQYHQQRFSVPGHELLDIINKISKEPAYDNDLIKEWGKHLDIEDWFTFTQYEPGNS
ncbi:MAG: hypothetical protein ACTSQ8_20115 [Candidatus Helarchaeota archaeon]